MGSAAALKPDDFVPRPPKPQRGLARRYQQLIVSSATVDEASRRLFGDVLERPINSSHRGEFLRYLLRTLYGSDYVRRGALLLCVRETALSQMMMTGLRVSRARVQRVEAALLASKKRRRRELRKLADLVEQAFAREQAMLADCDAVIADLNRLASHAVRLTQPIDARSGRFVSRPQRKMPELRERAGSSAGASSRSSPRKP